MNTQNFNKELISKREAEEILGVSYQGIAGLIHAGAIRIKIIGKRAKIVRRSIYEYLESNETNKAIEPQKNKRHIHALLPASERPRLYIPKTKKRA